MTRAVVELSRDCRALMPGLSKSISNAASEAAVGAGIAINSTVQFLEEHLSIKLSRSNRVRCTYSHKNKECARERCPYYAE